MWQVRNELKFGTIRGPSLLVYQFKNQERKSGRFFNEICQDLAFQTVRFPRRILYLLEYDVHPIKMWHPLSFIFIFITLFCSISFPLLSSNILNFFFVLYFKIYCPNYGTVSCFGCWWQCYWQNVDWKAPQNLFISW